MKTHWKKLTNPNYLGSYSLDETGDLTVQIDYVIKEMIKGTDGKEQECVVAHLKNNKPLILNKTNMKTISKLLKTPFIEDWKGHSIILFAEKVRAFGETVDALRVRPVLPKPKQVSNKAEKILNECKSLEDLKSAWLSLDSDEQSKYYSLKEEIKFKLS